MKKYTVIVLHTYKDVQLLLYWRYLVATRDEALTKAMRGVQGWEKGIEEVYKHENKMAILDAVQGYIYGTATPNAYEVYEQLEAIVLPHLTDYHEDLTKLDRDAIENKQPGRHFLLSYNTMGTHLCLLGPPRADWFEKPTSPYYGRHTIRQQLTNLMEGYKGKVDYGHPKPLGHVYFDGNELHQLSQDESHAVLKLWFDEALTHFTDQELAGHDYHNQ